MGGAKLAVMQRLDDNAAAASSGADDALLYGSLNDFEADRKRMRIAEERKMLVEFGLDPDAEENTCVRFEQK